ncbi:hypothetical protein AZ66_23290, partial [Paenibacillus sp. E194]
ILQRVRHTLGELQQKGLLRQDMSSEWIANVLYSLLILAWQQVHLGNIAKNSAAKLVVDTLYNGVNA